MIQLCHFSVSYGFGNPTYSFRLQPCSFTYRTVGTFSISVLKSCEFLLESKNFHSEPVRIFFDMTCLFFLTCSVLLSVCFRLVTLFVCVCFCLINLLYPWSKLFPWTTEDSSEVDDTFPRFLHQLGQNLHIKVLLKDFSWKKNFLFLSWNWSSDS